MATGDLKNNLRKLQSELKMIRYEKELDLKSVSEGVASAFLPVYDYVFTSYSRRVTQEINDKSMDLGGKTDMRFVETMYKILRELYSYKPPLTRDQYFQTGFGERKVIMCTEIIEKIRNRHKELAPKSIKSGKYTAPLPHSGLKMTLKSLSRDNLTEPKPASMPEGSAGKSKVAATKPASSASTAKSTAVSATHGCTLKPHLTTGHKHPHKSARPDTAPHGIIRRHTQPVIPSKMLHLPDTAGIRTTDAVAVALEHHRPEPMATSTPMEPNFPERIPPAAGATDAGATAHGAGVMASRAGTVTGPAQALKDIDTQQPIDIIAMSPIKPRSTGTTAGSAVPGNDAASDSWNCRVGMPESHAELNGVHNQLTVISETLSKLLRRVSGLESRMSDTEAAMRRLTAADNSSSTAHATKSHERGTHRDDGDVAVGGVHGGTVEQGTLADTTTALHNLMARMTLVENQLNIISFVKQENTYAKPVEGISQDKANRATDAPFQAKEADGSSSVDKATVVEKSPMQDTHSNPPVSESPPTDFQPPAVSDSAPTSLLPNTLVTDPNAAGNEVGKSQVNDTAARISELVRSTEQMLNMNPIPQ